MAAYCLECTTELADDSFKHCPNPRCSRFGLVTALYCSKRFTVEEMKAWQETLETAKFYKSDKPEKALEIREPGRCIVNTH